jgi:drug/metabolite transporter (DMT)-like permease
LASAATAVLDERARQRRGQLYVALAAVAWSTAGVLQRKLDVDAATQVAGRAAFAALTLLVYVAVAERGRVAHAFRSVGLAGVGVAVCVAIASGSFIIALNYTSVARVLFIQALSPALAAFFAWVALREPIGGRTALSLGLAFAGVAVMLGAPGDADLVGDSLSLLLSVAFAIALVIVRHRRDVSMAPATCLAQVMLVVVFLPFASPGDVSGDDMLLLATLGVVQIGVGLMCLTIGARLIPTAQVALITLLEVVLGPLWVWIAYDEQPGAATLAGGAIVVAAIVILTLGSPSPEASEPPADGAMPPPQ